MSEIIPAIEELKIVPGFCGLENRSGQYSRIVCDTLVLSGTSRGIRYLLG